MRPITLRTKMTNISSSTQIWTPVICWYCWFYLNRKVSASFISKVWSCCTWRWPWEGLLSMNSICHVLKWQHIKHIDGPIQNYLLQQVAEMLAMFMARHNFAEPKQSCQRCFVFCISAFTSQELRGKRIYLSWRYCSRHGSCVYGLMWY